MNSLVVIVNLFQNLKSMKFSLGDPESSSGGQKGDNSNLKKFLAQNIVPCQYITFFYSVKTFLALFLVRC
ncbi:hypothetical protein CSB09_03655 [Candidatus Gracilibacteria bacterium]|nr:MAG: hypothetical protein CSB09_03655 [Candidatus Gracilibacteria bacterium]